MELFKAHKQWSERPADETFDSVLSMHQACEGYRASAVEAPAKLSDLRVEAVTGDVQLVGRTGVPAALTHWAFGQLATRTGAPAGYLRTLPATLACQNLNHGLSDLAKQGTAGAAPADTKLMFHKNGHLLLRAFTSNDYSRIWNCDVTARLLRLQQDNPNWKLPLAYARRDGSKGFSGLTGELVPRGAYASDHDMFCFLVDESRRVGVKDGGDGLARGFFTWNSEVGASSWGVMTFLFDRVCGNHIVWGAKGVLELRVRHVGQANDRAFRGLATELRRYSESSTSDLEATIEHARGLELGKTKDEVLDAIFAKRIPDLSRKRLEDAYEVAEQTERYGSPRSVWGMVQGLTQLSQKTPHTDERVKLDRAAGKVLQIAF